jgi:hypothetical protein
MMYGHRALALATILLAIPIAAAGQVVKVSVAPADVDGARPTRVTVSAAADADKARLLQATSARVEGADAPVPVAVSAADVTFTPPPKPAGGTSTVRLMDASNAPVAEFPLVFRAAAPASATTPPPTTTTSAGTFTAAEEGRQGKLADTTWYYLLVSLTFLGIVGPFVYAIVASVWRGRSDSNPDNRPLGLPVGSFRSILAYSLVAYLGFYVMASVLSLSRFVPPDFLLGIVATVIGFYFGSRSEEGTVAEKTASVRGTVMQGDTPARGALVVFIRTADGVAPYSRVTDVSGRFELTGAAPGKYKVRATLTGAPPSDEQEVTLVAGSDHEVALKIAAPAPPQPGVIQGTVTKADGTAATGATVVLLQGSTEKSRRTAGAAGDYKLENVVPGDYQLQFSLSQFGSSEASVKVTAAGTHKVDARLK